MFAQRDHSVPGALALVDPEHAALEVAVKDGEIDQLLKSDAGPVEDLKDSPVTDSERGGEIRHVQYLSGLLFAQYRSRQPCFLLRLFDILGGVDKYLVLAFQELEEPLDCPYFDRDGGNGIVPFCFQLHKLCLVSGEGITIDPFEIRDIVCPEPLDELPEIPAVALQRRLCIVSYLHVFDAGKEEFVKIVAHDSPLLLL